MAQPPFGSPPPPPGTPGGPPPLPNRQAREIITNEAFAISPQLLGLPLARPSRRLVAILIDLALVAVLVQAGGTFFFGLATAVAFFRFAARGRGSRGLLGQSARFTFRALGAVVLFALSVSLVKRVTGDGEKDEDGAARVQASIGGALPEGTKVTPMAVARFLGELNAVRNADDEAGARRAAERLVTRMRELGVPEADIRGTLEETADESGKPFMRSAVDAVLARAFQGGPPAAKPLAPDSLAILYAAAVRAGPVETTRADTASADSATGDSAEEADGNESEGEEAKASAADSLGTRLGSVLARDSLDGLHRRVGELERERGALRKEIEEHEGRGLLATLLKFLDDLGLSFGWNALYFTAFTALWKGQTPGKKAMGIRVLRLNGQPMTLWASFERFGGYAAGLLTGLLGFAQVYWDRNRMAIHDKITETVVVRDGGVRAAAAPPPAAAARYPQNV